ncbi:MAG: hypothetical protein ACRC1Z_24710 [Waterburya sp.]
MINRLFRWRNFRFTICLSFLLISLSYLLPTVNQPLLAQSDFRLESDIISLKSRINRLEQEVNYLRSSTNSRNSGSRFLELTPPKPNQPSAPPNSGITIVDGKVIGRSDPLYSRLATLLIELKEQVNNIDRRLTVIEKTVP